MVNWFDGTGEIFTALMSLDSYEISEALKLPASWTLGLVFMMVAATLVLLIYRHVPLVEKYLESTVMTATYLTIGGIIFVEVFRRFILSQQAPWSTTLPPFLFLIMTWFGCSYNVKLRTHLSFAEFRTMMSRTGQMACLVMDAVLWLGFSWVVVVTSLRITANSAANFQIMLGTDDVMQWWFLITVPLAFILLAARVLENLLIDIENYKSGDVLIKQAVIGGGE